MKNSMTDLRNHLFEVIERLKDPQGTGDDIVDVEVAETICQVADRLLKSAEIEINYRRIVGVDSPSEFLDKRQNQLTEKS